MLKKILKKIKVIVKIIINEPYSQIIIFSNFISSFLSVIGIPLLVVAYQYSESLDKNLIPFYDTLSNIFGVIGIELSFYSLIGAALFLIIFGQTCFGIVEILNRYVQIKVVKEFSINLIKNYKNANWLNILEDKSGKFQYAINTEAHRASQVVLDSLRLTSGTIQLLFFLGTSFYFSPKITTILLFFFIFLGFITILVSVKINYLANFFNDERIKIAESVSNINNNKKYLKSSIFPNFFLNIYKNIEFAWNIDWKLNLYAFFLRYIVFILIAQLFTVLLIFYKELNTSFEEVAIAILIFLRTTPIFMKISESYGSLSETLPVYENFLKRSNFFRNAKEKSGNLFFEKQKIILFEKVFYKYPLTNKFIVKNLNLKIEPNKTYAIIGPSGSGKSTIVDLLMGLLRPSKGSIKYGHIDQKKLDLKSFRNKVSYISQNISLFDGTIKENLLVGKSKRHKDIVDICKLCMAFDFINSKPKKFDTLIGENAIKISGGQKQRILLARALLSESEIIILDEATNQLDERSIVYIRNTIKKIKTSKTIIIISHQKNIRMLADKTYYLTK
jgi:ABC-type bacteriocin/lantibiotic exporter with double-glycine peptidase domain